MKNKLALFMALLMSVAASPVFAGHDHGSQGSVDRGASQSPKNDQHAKDSEILLNSCAEYVGRIHQRVQKLQMEIKEKHVSTSVNDELKKLEQSLKEANDIVRSLQIM